MNIINSLEKLGLTKNESEIYLHLLSKGRYSTSEAYIELNLDKSSFYRSLGNLSKLGLVRITGEKRNQKFFPAPVSKLKKIQQDKLNEIESVGIHLNNLIEEINSNASKSYLKNNIQIFQGEEAYFEFMEQKLKRGVNLIRDITIGSDKLYAFAGSKKKYDKYVKYFIDERVKKNIKINMILDKSVSPIYSQISDELNLKEVRRYPKKLNINCFLNVFADKVGFMTIKAGKFWGLIIEDKLVSNLTAALFDAVCEQSEKI